MKSQTVHEPGHRGLSASGTAAEHHDLTALYREKNVVNSLSGTVFTAVVKTDISEFDHIPAAPFVVTSITMAALSAAKNSIAM